MKTNIFNECLRNSKDLDLMSIQLKFQRNKNIPKLITIYKLIFPFEIELNSITRNID